MFCVNPNRLYAWPRSLLLTIKQTPLETNSVCVHTLYPAPGRRRVPMPALTILQRESEVANNHCLKEKFKTMYYRMKKFKPRWFLIHPLCVFFLSTKSDYYERTPGSPRVWISLPLGELRSRVSFTREWLCMSRACVKPSHNLKALLPWPESLYQ